MFLPSFQTFARGVIGSHVQRQRMFVKTKLLPNISTSIHCTRRYYANFFFLKITKLSSLFQLGLGYYIHCPFLYHPPEPGTFCRKCSFLSFFFLSHLTHSLLTQQPTVGSIVPGVSLSPWGSRSGRLCRYAARPWRPWSGR